MCGIAGIWNVNSNLNLDKTIRLMTDKIEYRGPDDQGHWIDESANLALGHRRLSIVDLTEAGHQPMHSHSERWVIVYNGEVYNFSDIRKEIIETSRLKGTEITFRGTCDTEVILEAVELFGLEAAVKKMVGMFAIALYDRKEKILYLFRDRMGEKPLYYGTIGGAFVFASELKSLYSIPGFSNKIDRNALALYFRYNCVPAPFTIYQNLYKLEPGCFLKISNPFGKLPEPTRYWSVFDCIQNSGKNDERSEADIIKETERLMRNSISQQMIADVPVGAFLSGGIDSSLVVALMQDINSTPVNTFSIGFYEKGYNEAEEAQKVAAHLKTNHTELYVTAKQAMDVIPAIPRIYDEPFADSSQIPTYLVSKLAKSKVTVCLSGDAGDELFGGYNRYFLANNIWSKTSIIPRSGRKMLAKAIKLTPSETINTGYRKFSSILPAQFRYQMMGDKLHKLADILAEPDMQGVYRGLVSHCKQPEKFVLDSMEPQTVLADRRIQKIFSDDTAMMMGLDQVTYLPDDILVKVDRAAMAVSLETRVPLLDFRLVEHAVNIPTSMKIKDGKTKWPMREILYKYVPKELIERPKMGFGIPVGEWLTGDLREWAEDLLDENRLRSEGYLNAGMVRKLWEDHVGGKYNWQYPLWDILMFEMWLSEYE